MIKYYQIVIEEAKALGLAGYDKDVYFAIKAIREGVTMSQSELAKLLDIPMRSLIRTLGNLRRRGLITATGTQTIRGGVIYTYIANPLPNLHNDPLPKLQPSAKTTYNPLPNYTSPSAKTTETTLYSNLKVIDESNNAPAHTCEEERMKELQTLGKIYPTADLAKELIEELNGNTTIAMDAQRLFGRPAREIAETVELFVAKLNLDGETLKNRGDFRRHWQSWLKLNINQIFRNNNNGNNSINNDRKAAYADAVLSRILARQNNGNV